MNKITLLIIFVVLLQGCGGGSNDTTTKPKNETALEGAWIKPCGPNGFEFSISTIIISGNTSTWNNNYYEDNSCTIPSTFITVANFKSTFNIGKKMATSGGLQANELNFQHNEFNGAPTDFKTYDIFKIDGNLFYLGDKLTGNDGTTPELRPNALDFKQVFNRK